MFTIFRLRQGLFGNSSSCFFILCIKYLGLPEDKQRWNHNLGWHLSYGLCTFIVQGCTIIMYGLCVMWHDHDSNNACLSMQVKMCTVPGFTWIFLVHQYRYCRLDPYSQDVWWFPPLQDELHFYMYNVHHRESL